MRIIDENINTMRATVEHHEMQLRHCATGKEREYADKMSAAQAALVALVYYRAILDSYEKPNPAAAEPFDG